ncbi:unnamed protein product [Thelazia callipaeda]|uniref:Beta-hexosaminidase n=1 Tax=Thelazia callipaeda TaxID=103827 RepID=A0A0N5D855_THECL|nr:unnamed protein product [Thelazia callipaeda]
MRIISIILASLTQVIAWPDPYIRSKGAIWPKPQYIKSTGSFLSVNSESFQFISSIGECKIIDKAIIRYQRRLFGDKLIKHQKPTTNLSGKTLKNLTLFCDEGCTSDYPQLGIDESYALNITQNTAVLRANKVWGILRGLESFAQSFFDNNTKINEAEIEDYPRFIHRGVLLDTSRHYLSVNVIKANIELMAQNKFNTFHWHIVDTESFPFKSEVIPELVKGAYTPQHVYNISQIKEIIEFARLRGIRVIAEFDTPGHMKSWGFNFSTILATCYHSNGSVYQGFQNLLDPTNSETWDLLAALFQEVFTIFPDNYIHLGGDEVDMWINECWIQNPIYNMTNGFDLQTWYFKKFFALLHNLKSGNKKKFLVWQEALKQTTGSENNLLDSGLIAHIWKNNNDIIDATKRGYYAILSACWYLDLISTFADWKKYYLCDPQNFNGTGIQKSLVLGGEAALWGEWVDESNVMSRLWPRASAVAERLWSSAKTKSIAEAWPRLYEMQCRMAQQGYPAQPAEGPGFCEQEYKIILPQLD